MCFVILGHTYEMCLVLCVLESRVPCVDRWRKQVSCMKHPTQVESCMFPAFGNHIAKSRALLICMTTGLDDDY